VAGRGEAGLAFLSSQGDAWDTRKDMDLAGVAYTASLVHRVLRAVTSFFDLDLYAWSTSRSGRI